MLGLFQLRHGSLTFLKPMDRLIVLSTPGLLTRIWLTIFWMKAKVSGIFFILSHGWGKYYEGLEHKKWHYKMIDTNVVYGYSLGCQVKVPVALEFRYEGWRKEILGYSNTYRPSRVKTEAHGRGILTRPGGILKWPSGASQAELDSL